MRHLRLHPIFMLPILTVAAILLMAIAPGATRAGFYEVAIVEPRFDPRSWGYGPDPIHVVAGDTVTWTNTGRAPHSVTADDGSFDSGFMFNGAVWSLTPSTPGRYSYFCTLHPDMRATLFVW